MKIKECNYCGVLFNADYCPVCDHDTSEYGDEYTEYEIEIKIKSSNS